MLRPPPPRKPPGLPAAPTMVDAPAGRPTAPSVSGEEDRVLPQTFFLGRYRVVDEIGVGGMASVHLARVDGPGGFQKWVAIKRIHPHLVEDDQFVDMFLDEARIAASINHANVAQVFDLGKDEGTYWIAMEYLHGEPLREIMRRVEELRTIVPFHLAARICADAAEGLHCAHELRGRTGQLLNLVHRDVTPHNLFITYEGYTKVVDFGIAKVIDRLASTRAGTLKGKLAYMSPEQVRGHDVDRTTDIFALGVVLWELTCSRRLFRMETDLDTLERVQACVVPLPSSVVAGYPPMLEQIVMKALARRKEDRFPTARDFSRALQHFLMSLGAFVGSEDVGNYIQRLFEHRVKKRERYLEWAAEVTSTVDIETFRAQQAGDDAGSGAVVTSAAPTASQVQPHAHAPPRRPADHALAAQSLVDDDEEIPTVVDGSEEAEAQQARGWQPAPAPAAEEEDMNATIALPDGRQAAEIRAKLDAIERAQRQGPYQAAPAFPPAPPPVPPYPGQARAVPGPAPVANPAMAAAAGAYANPATAAGGAYGSGTYGQPQPGQPGAPQAYVETKMSMPRPTGAPQWTPDAADLQPPPARSTAVLALIALLSTLCIIGVGALVAYKLKPPRPPSPLIVPTAGSHSSSSVAPAWDEVAG
ncbi:MAG: serine/threonine protein kinase [Deltaproteobacteria bacterium]|nr:serine/threonine protein kinase [Deltaproteobacteria bacterium]